MNSSNNQENEATNSSFSATEESEPSSKKRKLSSVSSLTGIQLKFLQSENENLKKLVKELEDHILEFDGNSTDLMELEESNKKLIAENGDLQIKLKEQQNQHKSEMDLLQSTCNNYLEKIKVIESKNKEFEESVQKLNEEISLMKTIKSEIKDETEKEKLNAEIQKLQKKNSDLKQKYNDCETAKQELKEEKTEVEQRIGKLEDEIQSVKDSMEADTQKFMEEKASLQAEIKKIKTERNYLRKKRTSLEKAAQEDKNLLVEWEAKYKKVESDLLVLQKKISSSYEDGEMDSSNTARDDGASTIPSTNPPSPTTPSSSSDNEKNDDPFIFELRTLRQQKNHIDHFSRDLTVSETRDLAKTAFCFYCHKLINTALSSHYDPNHAYCIHRFKYLSKAHSAEKFTALWKSNVLQYTIILPSVIQSLLNQVGPVQTAHFLDGAIVFGHLIKNIKQPEFDEIRRHMTRL